jgi:tRNA U38,U39,U40 pseudouridine synthase TruA
MVRRIAAVLIEVGRGEMNDTEVREALMARTPARNGASAPAKGLCLRRVGLGRRPGTGDNDQDNDEHHEIDGDHGDD